MPTRYTYTENQITTMQGALEFARDKYRENARLLREPAGEGPELAATYTRLAEQFDRQAADCETLLVFLEEQGKEV